MNSEIKTEEIKKTKVFSKWVVFHSISLLVAFFYYSYLDVFNEEDIQMEGGGKGFEALGVFVSVMLIPWIIALINRLWKKQPSTTGHFVAYYVILFFWLFFFISSGLMYHKALNLNFWSKFEDDSRFAVFMLSVFFLIIFLALRLLIIKANNYKPIKVNVTHNPDLKRAIIPVISRRQKEKRLLFLLLGLLFIITLAIVLKELLS